jgi:microcystin-dependent protein
MPLDFPSSPSDGQVYDGYYYDATAGVWQSNNGTQVPNIFKNAEYTSAQTYMVPLTVKGKLGQTADLQRWTDSTGNVLAAIDDEGVMTVQSLVAIQPIVAVPTGSLMPFAGTSAPEYFLLCQGQEVSRETYANLFSIIGTTYGVGDNSTTFNLPNLQGRMPVGRDSSQTEFDSLGEVGGAKTHTLTESELPAHTHNNTLNNNVVASSSHRHDFQFSLLDSSYDASGPNAAMGTAGQAGAWKYSTSTWQGGTLNASVSTTFNSVSGAVNGTGGRYTSTGDTTTPSSTATVGITNASTGSGSEHNNLQPYVVTNYIIKT